KAGKVALAGLPHPPVGRLPVSERSHLKATGRHRHYRFPPSAEARRTRERNSDLYPNGSAPRAAVAISAIRSKLNFAVASSSRGFWRKAGTAMEKRWSVAAALKDDTSSAAVTGVVMSLDTSSSGSL